MKFEIVNETELERAGLKKENIKIPTRATKGSAGYDFSSPIDTTIRYNETVIIPTGIKADLNENTFLQIHVRSSIGIKRGIVLANCTGIIDKDFYGNEDNDGNIMLGLTNTREKPFEVRTGDRLAQGIIISYHTIKDDTAKGARSGGIGSTSKNL